MISGISDRFLLVIAGPTAVGKTRFAIDLAQRLDTVILSSDSRQFFRELKIGTAKPEPSELQEVKHYFIDHLSIHDYYNVSRYENEVLALLPELFRNHQVVIMAGGSGLYIDAVCKGVDDFPEPDPELRKYLKVLFEEEGIESLRQLLLKLDPEYCIHADMANPKRLMRALEVCMSTGRTFSSQRTNRTRTREFRILKILLDLPRPVLFDQIHNRVDIMIRSGLIDEAAELYPHRHLNALNTVGYKELFEYFDKQVSLDQAIENIKTNTRRYAKRQMTWFRKDSEYHWFSPGQQDDVLSLLRNSSEMTIL